MIRYFTILILIPLWLPAQDSYPLTVNSGGLHVAADATLNIAGMELTPTSDYSFTVNTTNTVSLTNSSETVNDLEKRSILLIIIISITITVGVGVGNRRQKNAKRNERGIESNEL